MNLTKDEIEEYNQLAIMSLKHLKLVKCEEC